MRSARSGSNIPGTEAVSRPLRWRADLGEGEGTMPKGARGSRSLGERLASNPWIVSLGVVAAVVGIAAFVTGKNLPDFFAKRATHQAPVTSRSPMVIHTADASPRPSAKRTISESPAPSQANTPALIPPAGSTWYGLTAPTVAEIKSCIQQRANDTNLADYGLNDANLGTAATLHISVAAGDYTYRLIAADSSCQPETVVTVGPGQTATVHLYFGAMWDFDYPGEQWVPGDPSPIGPDQLGPFIFSKPTTTITITTP
jgi:hypothetical protein